MIDQTDIIVYFHTSSNINGRLVAIFWLVLLLSCNLSVLSIFLSFSFFLSFLPLSLSSFPSLSLSVFISLSHSLSRSLCKFGARNQHNNGVSRTNLQYTSYKQNQIYISCEDSPITITALSV